MMTPFKKVASVLSVAGGLVSPVAAGAADLIEVSSVEALRDAIADAPRGATLRVRAGLYLVTQPIVIDRNDLTVEGAGDTTLFRLAADSNEPVFVLGNATLENLEGTRPRRNLTLRRLRVDGNRLEQEAEVSDTLGLEFLRNNCVSLRQVTNVVLEDLRLASCRSGGIVVGNKSRQIAIQQVESFDHHFDGLAWDGDVQESTIDNSSFHSNLGAGISFDLGVVNNVIRRTIVRNNRKVGIFLSDSSENLFVRCVIERNGEEGDDEDGDGVFIRDGDGAGAASRNNTFKDCQILFNVRNGIFQAGEVSTGNRVVRGAICGNGNPITESFPTKAPIIVDDRTIFDCDL